MVSAQSAEQWRKENRSAAVIVVTIVATTLSATLMICRFISRRMINFAAEQSYLVGITMIKLSILLFYRRIFTLRKHVIAIYIFMGIAIGWLIVFLITCMTTCDPVSKWWTDLLSCRNPHADFVASAATNTIIDLGILCIPIWAISQLGLKKSQKTSAAGLFLTGGLVVFASIGRMVALIQTSMVDITYGYVPAATWSIAEVNLAVVSACLPFLQPLGLRVWGGVRSQITTHTRRSSFRSSFPPEPYKLPYKLSSEKASSEGDRVSREDDTSNFCPKGGENHTVIEGNLDSPLRDPEAAYIRVETSVSMEIKRSSRTWQEQWEKF
ncbi:hypothetical protein GTA08_BOTSDO13872 [Neofusicoccum parvum]|nr:hypothetical protein GTA08_BOTSDO13872 [Neofusicoccum parvum]